MRVTLSIIKADIGGFVGHSESHPDVLAEAVAIMESNSITCLLILDNDKRPEGVIHLHDLLKAGVV